MIYRIDKNLTVREFETKDLKIKYFTWFQDQVVTRYSSHGKFTKGKKYYQNYLENFLMNKDRVLWAICFDNKHIGNITLGNISAINRTAEFSIIIGDKNFWKKNISNLVSSSGVVASDTTGVGTARRGLAAARYGTDKGIFAYGLTGSRVSLSNLVSNTGVVASDVTGVGTARNYIGVS